MLGWVGESRFFLTFFFWLLCAVLFLGLYFRVVCYCSLVPRYSQHFFRTAMPLYHLLPHINPIYDDI